MRKMRVKDKEEGQRLGSDLKCTYGVVMMLRLSRNKTKPKTKQPSDLPQFGSDSP
ncbi:hypothetical protein Sjap_002530 [Stephania japonica]|uniref:Uncharacterized protein n=1 Tax=Stephania japonica TaxID=461633 RepID=A0AAP0PU90_9MAGN